MSFIVCSDLGFMLSWAIESVRMLLRSLLPVLILLARVMRVATSKLLPTMFLNNYEGRILSDVGMEMKEPFRLRKERMRKGKNIFCSIDFFFVWARNAQACRQVGISKNYCDAF